MEKKFEIPEAIIIDFGEEEDIITASSFGMRYGTTGDEWRDDESF